MAELALTWVSGLWVAFAFAAVALVALVLRARPITKGNIALVALLIQQAWQTLSAVLREASTDPALQVQATYAAIPAWLLWSPLVFLAGALILGNAPHARIARILGVAGAAPNIVLLVAGAFAPGLIIRADGSGFTELAASLLILVFVGFAFTVAVLAREALTTPLEVRRGQFALLAAAFSVEGAYHAAQNTAKVALGLEFHGAASASLAQSVLSVAPMLLFGAVAGWAAFLALRDPDAGRRRWARILVGFIGASALTGVLASPLTAINEFTNPLGAFHAFWDLAALALIVFAGMRYQLFSLERRAQQSVAVTTALVVGFVLFKVLEQTAQDFVQSNVGGLPAPGIIAALAVGVVSIPIGKLGTNVGHKLFPKVTKTLDYEHRRRLEIYRAALEGAFADGIATPREAASLKRLRAELKIAEEEHDDLETMVRVQLAHGTAGAAPA